MAAILFFLLIAIPIAELYVIVQVAQSIGFFQTLALLIAVSIAGAWLLKREGMATWARLQQTLANGQMPTNEVTDGALILLGGALLLTPGFLSDIVGLVFLIPATRALVKGGTRKLLGGWARRKVGVVGTVGRAGGKVYEAGVVRRSSAAKRPADTSATSTTTTRLPGVDEADSPDRG